MGNITGEWEMVTEKGMVGTFWRSGDRIVAKHRLASGRIHSRATIHSGYLLLEQRSRVKGSSRGNECSREKWLTLFGLDLDRSFHRLAYRSDFLKEFTLPRILLGIVKPAPSSICQTVELPFDETFPYTNHRVTDILAYRLRQKLRDSLQNVWS